MNDLPPFRRYETLQGVEYEMLSSSGKSYYTVPMVGLVAAGCECRYSKFNPTCKHQQEAERQEALYQGEQQPVEPASGIGERGSLNYGDRGFSLLR